MALSFSWLAIHGGVVLHAQRLEGAPRSGERTYDGADPSGEGIALAIPRPDVVDVLTHFSGRASIVLEGFSSVLSDDSLVNMRSRGRLAGEGLATLIASAVILAVRRRRLPLPSLVALLLGGVFVAFVFSSLMVTPRDITWHVRTSIGRLLLLPSIFLLLSAFFSVRDGTHGGGGLRQDDRRP